MIDQQACELYTILGIWSVPFLDLGILKCIMSTLASCQNKTKQLLSSSSFLSH